MGEVKGLSFDEFKSRLKLEIGFDEQDTFDSMTEKLLTLFFCSTVVIKKWEQERDYDKLPINTKTLM